MNLTRLLLLFVTCAGLLRAAPLLETSDVFPQKMAGIARYRIPGIVVTTKGTVLAYAEARRNDSSDWGEIEIHLRRSLDGGKTWQPPQHIAHTAARLEGNPRKAAGGEREQTVNNPVAIVDRTTGAIEFLYCINYARCFSMRSNDDGLTWTQPVEITATFDRFRSEIDWQAIATGPGHGIELRGGRLIVPVWLATYEKTATQRKGCSVIFSDDGGANWQRGAVAMTIGGESSVAELSDGRVVLSSRNTDQRNRRAVVYSRDGATGWTKAEFIEELLEPGCMAGLVSHPGGPGANRPLLLHSSPRTTDRAHRERKNVTIHVSHDDGRTWPERKLLQAGPSAYSDLAVLPDGTVLCLYENGKPGDTRRNGDWAYARLTLARFNLEWLQAPP